MSDKRTSVILLITPPEALRDAPLDTIRAVITQQGPELLEMIAQEIRRWFTSAPLDPEQAARFAEALREVDPDGSKFPRVTP